MTVVVVDIMVGAISDVADVVGGLIVCVIVILFKLWNAFGVLVNTLVVCGTGVVVVLLLV